MMLRRSIAMRRRNFINGDAANEKAASKGGPFSPERR
jgi:hypothetical protein